MEEQIKRRVAIGSFVSERKLVDELVRCGGGAGWCGAVRCDAVRQCVFLLTVHIFSSTAAPVSAGTCHIATDPLLPPLPSDTPPHPVPAAAAAASLLLLPSHCCWVGFSENLVRKGLMYLQTTGDFEYRRERRLVHRMK